MCVDCSQGYTATILPSVYKHVGVEPGEELPAFAWPGGYPIAYYDREGNTLCAKCATKTEEYTADVVGADVLEGDAEIDHGGPVVCMDCDATILGDD